MPKKRAFADVGGGAVAQTNTICSYYAAAPVAAAVPATADARPPNLFPNGERRHKTTVMKDGKACSVYVSDACRDGTLKGGCHGTC